MNLLSSCLLITPTLSIGLGEGEAENVLLYTVQLFHEGWLDMHFAKFNAAEHQRLEKNRAISIHCYTGLVHDGKTRR